MIMETTKADHEDLSRSWIVETPERLLGAHVSGWSAVVVDALLSRHVRPYLPAMTLVQRQEVESCRREVHAAALLWHASTSASASTQTPIAEIAPQSQSEELTTSQAAIMLDLTEQRVRQLAACWTADGLARKVGRVWLIDRTAVVMYRHKDRRSAA
jgi:hypothetical protein